MSVWTDLVDGLARRKQRDQDWPVSVRTATAYARLVQRMIAGDHPDDDTDDAMNAWVYGLTFDEIAAFNSLFGTNYGPHRQCWFTTDDSAIVRFFKSYMKWKL